MKYIFNILIYLLIYTVSNAQTETTNWFYHLENNPSSSTRLQEARATLKILNLNRYSDINTFLGTHLKQAINKGDLTIYQDRKCKKAFSVATAQNLILSTETDTIRNSSSEITKIIHNKVSYFPIEQTIYELEQSWKYDKKQQQLIMSLDTIHICYLKTDKYGRIDNLENRIYLFSIKNADVQNVIPQEELQKMSVIWAKEFSYLGTFENKKLRKKLLSKKHINAHKIVTNQDRSKLLPPDEIKRLTTTRTEIDTIITFDPETFEENFHVVEDKIFYDAKHITSFRIVQEFYFDTATNTFKTRITAIAPMRKVYDNNGNFKYEMPLFRIVYAENYMDASKNAGDLLFNNEQN